MKKAFWVGKLSVDLVLTVVAFFFALGVSYYFGWTLLRGAVSWGNDGPFAMSFVAFLDRSYPHIPSWFYSWAGGMPFWKPYPVLPTFVTFFVHLFSDWTIQQTMRFLFWFSVPLSSWGVIVLTRLITKNWFAGFLAGLLMVLSPDSWLWITNGGFYAFSISVPVFTWSLVFFTLAFKLRRKLFWILAVIAYALVWVFHPMAGTLVTIVMPILGIGFALEAGEKWYMGLTKTFLVIFFGAMLSAWWIVPFYLTRQNQGIGSSADSIVSLTFREIVGLDFAHDSIYITSTFFTASAAILFLIGVVISFFRKGVVKFIAISSLLALFIIISPRFMPKGILELLNVFFQATNVRSALILRILGPVVAAYGAISIARPIFWLSEKLFRKLKESSIWKVFETIICSAVGLLAFFIIFKNVTIIPPMPDGVKSLYLGYGPMYRWGNPSPENGIQYVLLDGKKIRLFPSASDIVKTILSGHIQVDDWVSPWNKIIMAAASEMNLTNKNRIEIPPYSGSLSGSITSVSDVNIIPSYSGITSIARMWGWQVTCFYYSTACRSTDVEDLTRWFGLSGIWLGGHGTDGENANGVLQKIKESPLFEFNKSQINAEGTTEEWNSFKFLEPTGLASIANKPTILVVGDNNPNHDVFDTVFRALSRIDFGYKYAWSVRGKGYIDSYSLNELNKFDIVVLHAYKYHSRSNAWNLLQKYVEGGGRLLIDNGWQYYDADWGTIKEGKVLPLSMPNLFPVKNTTWGTINKNWNLEIPQSEISSGVGATNWGKPVYENDGWGASVAKTEDLKPGATVLLKDNGRIISASQNVGKGKVVWTGFDFWGHLTQADGTDEELFLKNILVWLSSDLGSSETKIDFTRVNPDLVTIQISPDFSDKKLLFKEAETSNWGARLVVGNKKIKLPIYSAGPGWKMVFLPKIVGDGQVEFFYHSILIEKIAFVLSFLTFVFLILYLLGIAPKPKFRLKLSFLNKMKEKWSSEE